MESRKASLREKRKMKNKTNKVPQRSRVPVPCSNEVSDSNDDPQPEYGQVAIVVKPQRKAQEACKPPNNERHVGWNDTPRP